MELLDYVEGLAGTYARLLLLLDLARPFAAELGESVMVNDLNEMVAEVGARLDELSGEISARKVVSGE